MPIVATKAAPSTLADVLGQVQDLFAAVADATPIMVGKQYLEAFGTGSPPRVLFVPEPRGKLGPPVDLGCAASIIHSCNVFVRGAESGDDLQRFRAAYALGDRTISAIRRAASGRLEFGDYGDDSPTDVDAYGADIAFSFTYQRDVRHDAAIRAVPAAAADTSARQPLIPPGTPADSEAFVVTTEPEE